MGGVHEIITLEEEQRRGAIISAMRASMGTSRRATAKERRLHSSIAPTAGTASK